MSDYRDSATRFFWAWLICGTAASILGNVTHALLSVAGRPDGHAVIAASMALAPPVVLLLATHGVHALVRSRIVGRSYWAALAITVALAMCAFVLSFEALRDLAQTYAGMRSAVAWLWPLSIDLSITAATIALLALSSAVRVEQLDEPAVESEGEEHRDHVHVRLDDSAVALGEYLKSVNVHGVAPHTYEPQQMTATIELIDDDSTGDDDAVDDASMASVEVYHVEAAGRMVEAGVTRIDALRVARVLAEYDSNTAPSTIARKLGLGYETVVKILDSYTEAGVNA